MTNKSRTSRSTGRAPEAIPLCASPATVLHALEGAIVDAQIAYPGVLHVEIRDARGGRWRLASQDAEWSPAEPSQLIGRSVMGGQIEETSGALRCALSDGTMLQIGATGEPGADELPTWELISPTGLALEFGPGIRWRIAGAGSTVEGSAPRHR